MKHATLLTLKRHYLLGISGRGKMSNDTANELLRRIVWVQLIQQMNGVESAALEADRDERDNGAMEEACIAEVEKLRRSWFGDGGVKSWRSWVLEFGASESRGHRRARLSQEAVGFRELVKIEEKWWNIGKESC
ncbi:hypothetical protein TorRG33x02_123360 [Trema orientale]|uniref:Uncharacterized protein n=1 Tax=Trema orientale TaxID=63057 RepID=A0A2P5F1S7_TREOI|nr:hypothetical protein TorRG33x02_123360 [Trema orientale]